MPNKCGLNHASQIVSLASGLCKRSQPGDFPRKISGLAERRDDDLVK